MNTAEKILYALQFEIERPKTFGLFHLVCVSVALFLAIFLIVRKEKNHLRVLNTVLAVYGIGSFVLEAAKQIVWSFNYDQATGIVTWDYQWYAFPFQFCTTPMIVSIVCLFVKNERAKEILFSFLAFVTVLGSLATAIYPESCFTTTLLVDVHTMYLHLGSLVVSAYLLAREVKITFKNLINGYLVFIFFAAVAEAMNVVMFKSGIPDGETFNMFFISPYFTSSLPVYDVVQTNTPFLVYILFYLFTVFAGALIVWSIALLVKKLSAKKYKKSAVYGN